MRLSNNHTTRSRDLHLPGPDAYQAAGRENQVPKPSEFSMETTPVVPSTRHCGCRVRVYLSRKSLLVSAFAQPETVFDLSARPTVTQANKEPAIAVWRHRHSLGPHFFEEPKLETCGPVSLRN